MDDQDITQIPGLLDPILRDTEAIGFTLASEPKTGSLLRTLAASKPGRRFLELGTGTGVGTTWLLAGMDAGSRLISVDSDAKVLEVARRHLGHDARVTFHLADGAAFLEQAAPQQFDFIYAAAWLTIAVQLGFVCGALVSSLLNLPDVVSPRHVILGGSIGAATANGLLEVAGGGAVGIPLRFVTGFFLFLPPGPALGALAKLRLKSLPEATRLAGGIG
jgi:SAM-dependent methyltransferase